MTAPQYALLSALAFDRLPRARLEELLAEVQARPPFEGYQLAIDGQHRPTNAQLGRLLRHAHEAWINAAYKAHPALVSAAPTRTLDAGKAKLARPAPTRTHSRPQSITRGAEALAIFAAIPACPVWGADPCTCALCTPPQEVASR